MFGSHSPFPRLLKYLKGKHWLYKPNLVVRNKETKKQIQKVNTKSKQIYTPLAVPIGRQIDAREPHVDAGQVSEVAGGSWSEVWRLGVGKRLLIGKRLLKG